MFQIGKPPHSRFCAALFHGGAFMIVILKPGTLPEKKDHLISWLEAQRLTVHISEGKDYTVLGLVGDTGHIDVDLLQSRCKDWTIA